MTPKFQKIREIWKIENCFVLICPNFSFFTDGHMSVSGPDTHLLPGLAGVVPLEGLDLEGGPVNDGKGVVDVRAEVRVHVLRPERHRGGPVLRPVREVAHLDALAWGRAPVGRGGRGGGRGVGIGGRGGGVGGRGRGHAGGATFGCVCLRLATLQVLYMSLNCIWLCLAAFGRVWLRLAEFGCVWLRYVGLKCIWLCLVAFGCIWLRLVSFGCIWLRLARFGCVWLR